MRSKPIQRLREAIPRKESALSAEERWTVKPNSIHAMGLFVKSMKAIKMQNVAAKCKDGLDSFWTNDGMTNIESKSPMIG